MAYMFTELIKLNSKLYNIPKIVKIMACYCINYILFLMQSEFIDTRIKFYYNKTS